MRKNSLFAALCALLALVLLLASCAQSLEEPVYRMGDTVSSYWFDFKLTKAESVTEWEDCVPEEGDQIVLCTVEIRSTVEGTVPMGWDDFLLMWGDGEAAAPEPYGSDQQLPDEFELMEGDVVSGLLVYEIPADVKEPSLVFQERFAEGDSESTFVPGDMYSVKFALN